MVLGEDEMRAAAHAQDEAGARRSSAICPRSKLLSTVVVIAKVTSACMTTILVCLELEGAAETSGGSGPVLMLTGQWWGVFIEPRTPPWSPGPCNMLPPSAPTFPGFAAWGQTSNVSSCLGSNFNPTAYQP